jgi:hypothetical protein
MVTYPVTLPRKMGGKNDIVLTTNISPQVAIAMGFSDTAKTYPWGWIK